MKAIIIDDDKKAINDLAEKLSAYPDIDVTATASNPTMGLKMIEAETPDVLFLDVEMPEMTGIDFLREMRRTGISCHVVVTTSFSVYMLPAFRNYAYDFLTKPIQEKELETVVQRVRTELSSPRNDAARQDVNDKDTAQTQNGFLLCYTNSEDFQLVSTASIGLFSYSSEMRTWEVVIANQKQPVRLKRDVANKDLLALDSRFVQVSQKFIVNINCLQKVCDNMCVFNPPFEEINYVKVGRLYRKRLVERFISF